MVFHFSGTLLRYVDYRREIAYECGTLGEATRRLLDDFPQLEELILTAPDTLKRTVRIAVNDEAVRSDLSRSLASGDVVRIIAAIAGG